MASQYVLDLRSKGLATNEHGVRVSIVEQFGGDAGILTCGRLWLRFPDEGARWHWIGFGSNKQAFIEATTLKAKTPEQIREKYKLKG